MSHYFPDSNSVPVKEMFDTQIMIKSVVFQDNGKGEFAIFLVERDNMRFSFSCGAKVLMGLMYKYFASIGYRLEKEKVFELPNELEIILHQRKSKEGRLYIDFEQVI